MAAQLVPCMVQDYWYLGPCKVEVWCAWAIRDTGTESCTCCNIIVLPVQVNPTVGFTMQCLMLLSLNEL